MLFSPAWILVLKLHGLYDNDHRRIRHSTLDELPSLVSASVLGTLVLDGLLALSPVGPLSPASAIAVGVGALVGSFVLRGVLRFFWHRLTGLAAGIVIGPAGGGRHGRAPGLDPPRDPPGAGRLPLRQRRRPTAGAAAAGLDRRDLPGRPRVRDRARVVTEQEMSEPAAERLIEECKEEGLALTFLPQHYGLLGPGIELNRLAELPVLDFRFSDPPRSTVAMKRAMDMVVSGLLLVLLSPLLLAIAIAILLDSGRPVFFRQRRAGNEGEPFTMLKFRTMVADAEERLGDLVDLAKLEQPAFKIVERPAGDPGRAARCGASASTSCRS